MSDPAAPLVVDPPLPGANENARDGDLRDGSLRRGALILSWADDAPVLLAVDGIGSGAPLVEVFTADEHHQRTSQGYLRSAVGHRLRYVGHRIEGDALRLRQRDARTGIEVESILDSSATAAAHRIRQIVSATTTEVVLTAVTTANVGVGIDGSLEHTEVLWGESAWLAEGRWRQHPVREVMPELDLPLHGQDGRGRWGVGSTGSWSTGEYLPTGALIDRRSGRAIAWQIESSAGWRWEFSETAEGLVLALLGPTQLEHQFAELLRPGDTFETVPAAVAVAHGGRDAAVAELTRYRRELVGARPGDLPVIYNDFMNTLMGEPSTERLLPLIGAAAEVGAELFCIDAGWFADPHGGDWWASVGDWSEAEGRFSGGLRAVIDEIHARGMRSGLWLEPEVVGAASPVADRLPEEAFFRRFGRRVQEHRRYHLDLRHPAARAHLDEAVDRLVDEFGLSLLKLDYNINAGAGTDLGAAGAGAGLLGHTRALRDWLDGVRVRHPGLLLENCSSGAMRMDYGLMAGMHLQSTTDQQDHRLCPPIVAAAPLSLLPEQCGNWAYPHESMSDEEMAFSLVGGIAGRMYLSGFLHRLRPEQRALVRSAVDVSRAWRRWLPEAVPSWPLGLPGWTDELIALELRAGPRSLLAVWWRGADPGRVTLPVAARGIRPLFGPAPDDAWAPELHAGGLVLAPTPGPSARVYELRH